MTNVEQQDARFVAMDAAIVAAIRLHAPAFEADYLDDNLPRWFQNVLDHCTDEAERVVCCTDAVFIEMLSASLGDALLGPQAITDAPGIVPAFCESPSAKRTASRSRRSR